MRWLELSVEADVEAVEAVSEILGRVSTGTAVQPTRLLRDPDDELVVRDDPTAPYVVTAYLADGEAARQRVEEVERALWHLQAFGLRAVGSLGVRGVDDADWIEAWKEHYTPQRIGRVVILPSWVDHSPAPDDAVVILDPGMAFGTGLHPTTRACLTLLQEISPMPQRVLDVGSGSGVLALAALRLGAGLAVAYDTDPAAVDAGRTNAERNGLGRRFEARAGTLPAAADERYPLVLANLVAALLVELAPRLAAHLEPRGVLLAAGIVGERADEVTSALSASGLTVTGRRDDGEWAALRVERPA